MKKYLHWILAHKISVFSFYVGIFLFSIYSIFKIEIALLPTLPANRIRIVTKFPGSDVERVDHLVSIPLTNALESLPGIQKILSKSQNEYSILDIYFKGRENLGMKLLMIRERLDRERELLPREIEKPFVSIPFSTGGASMKIIVQTKNFDKTQDVAKYAQKKWMSHLEKIEGVSFVEFVGGKERIAILQIDNQKLISSGLDLSIVKNYFKENFNRFSLGMIKSDNQEFSFVLDSREKGENLLKKYFIPIGTKAVPLNEFAELNTEYKDRDSSSLYNGEESMIFLVFPEAGENLIQLHEKIRIALEEISRSDYKFQYSIIYDSSLLIKKIIDNLLFSLALGLFLSFFILLFTLKNWSSIFSVFICILLSFAISVFLLEMLTVSLNLLSVSGFILASGILFDLSNVVLSSISRVKNFHSENEIIDSIEEVFSSATASSVTTLIVFLPIAFLELEPGASFQNLAVSVCILIAVNFLIGFSLLPVLFVYFSHRFPKKLEIPCAKKFDKKVYEYYKIIYNIISPNKILIIWLFLLAIGILLFFWISKEMLPSSQSNLLLVRGDFPPNWSREKKKNILDKIDTILKEISELENTVIVWRPGALDRELEVQFQVRYLDQKKMKQIREKFFQLEIFDLELLDPVDVLSQIFPGAETTVWVEGEAEEDIRKISLEIKKSLQNYTNGFVDDLSLRNSQYIFEPNPEKLFMSGISLSRIRERISLGLDFQEDLKLEWEGSQIPLYIQEKKEKQTFFTDFQLTSASSFTSVSELGKLTYEESLFRIHRKDGNLGNFILISGMNKKEFQNFLQTDSQIAKHKSNIHTSEIWAEGLASFRELGMAVLSSLVLLFLFLSGRFESFRVGILVLSVAFFVYPGVILFLFICGESINSGTILGIFLLTGTIVDSTVLYLEYFFLYRNRNFSKTNSISLSGISILRVILINLSTTVLALAPVILFSSNGSEFTTAMSYSIFGGVFFCSFFTIFIFPKLLWKYL